MLLVDQAVCVPRIEDRRERAGWSAGQGWREAEEPTGKPTKGIWEVDFLFYSYVFVLAVGFGRWCGLSRHSLESSKLSWSRSQVLCRLSPER